MWPWLTISAWILRGSAFRSPILLISAGRGVAEVEQDRALLLLALRFQEQRQAPLVVQDVAGIGAATRPRALMNDAVDRAAAQELIVHAGRSAPASTACRSSER